MQHMGYSIGYTGFSLDDFIRTLKDNSISLLVDVRSSPYSQRYPDYNKENLARVLKRSGIYYRNYAKEFGARQDDPSFYTADGYLDFEVFSQSEQFRDGINKLLTSTEKGYTFVLMCAEKDPFNCHRSFLVSRALYESGCDITHLLPGGKSMCHREIEQMLLDKYFPDRNQLNLFGEPLEDSECLVRAYRIRSSEIAYHNDEVET